MLCLPLMLAEHAIAQAVAPVAAQPQDEVKTGKSKAKTKAVKSEAPAAKKDPAAVQQQIDAGAAALQAGKTDVAVQQLTSAIVGGGLTSAQMARAQYQRGLAYRKQGKTALAISDLTQALYIKNGLVEVDRTDAMQNRMAAYRDAGLPDQDDGQAAKIATPTRTAATTPSSPPATTTGTPIAPRAVAGLAPQPETSSPPSSGLGGFFGNLFGGSSSSEAAPPPATPAKPVEVANSAWSAGTAVKPAAVATVAPAKSPKLATPAAKLPWQQSSAVSNGTIVQTSAPAGSFELQVAQLKMRAEAEAVAAQITQQFGADFAGRQASIVAVQQGGFGTLHRVSVGPFATAADWKTLCPKLLGAKLDCLPLKQ